MINVKAISIEDYTDKHEFGWKKEIEHKVLFTENVYCNDAFELLCSS